MVNPISPSDLSQPPTIPEFVIEAFNQLISKNWKGSSAIVTQEEVLTRILDTKASLDDEARSEFRREIFANHWLDVESIFEEAGWKVIFTKPPYYETNWGAFFKFVIP